MEGQRPYHITARPGRVKYPTISAERHTKHFTYSADDGFDHNFVTRKHESVKLSIPFFKQFWEAGKKDRENGITREKANKHVQYFYSDDFLLPLKTTVYSRARNITQPGHH
ncbi:Exc2 family lipoprotein [Serratia proteamaculans]|uniref:Exc2 family lipoprotein n=1 Tax=Serratia proteamaculans TaxID=28151 RepID=UPI0024B99909|nr:Exc2 family lipoprotein [Serratia proteamaculans]